MANTISVGDWLGALETEYLEDFVRDGGSTVKFAVVPSERKTELRTAAQSRCVELGCAFVELDAASIRAHMPQDIFFGLATQLDWPQLARRVVLGIAADEGFSVDGIDPIDDAAVFEAIATVNGVEARSVRQELRPPIERRVRNNAGMARDFRVAMSHFCLSRETPHPLVHWLTGANTRISNIRSFSVHTPINRTTARYFIESALFWIHHAGFAGTVVLFDTSRVTVARNPRDGGRYYTKAMAVDHYELLREFIDDVDRLAATLLAVVTAPEFIEDDGVRSWNIYDALRTRIMDDVRDRNLVNPVAPLVRLS